MKNQEENPRFNISACIEKTLKNGGTYEYFREKVLERKLESRNFNEKPQSVPINEEVTKQDWWNEVILEALKPENGSIPLKLQIIKERGCKTRLLSKTKAAISAVLTKVNDQATTLCKNIKGIREGFQLHSKNETKSQIGAQEILNTLTEFGQYPVRSFYESDCSEATDHINPEYARIIIEELANCLNWNDLEKTIALKTVSTSHDDRYFIIQDYDIHQTPSEYVNEELDMTNLDPKDLRNIRTILNFDKPTKSEIIAAKTQTDSQSTESSSSTSSDSSSSSSSDSDDMPKSMGSKSYLKSLQKKKEKEKKKKQKKVRALQFAMMSTQKQYLIPKIFFKEPITRIETIQEMTHSKTQDIKEPKKLNGPRLLEVNSEDRRRIKELQDQIKYLIKEGRKYGTKLKPSKPTNRELFVDFHQLIETGCMSKGNLIYITTNNKLVIERSDGTIETLIYPKFSTEDLRQQVLELHIISDQYKSMDSVDIINLTILEPNNIIELIPTTVNKPPILLRSWVNEPIEYKEPPVKHVPNNIPDKSQEPPADRGKYILPFQQAEYYELTTEWIDNDPEDTKTTFTRRTIKQGEWKSKIEQEIEDELKITPTTKTMKKDDSGDSYLELTYPQNSGTQMGLRLSFPILCLLHLYACYKAGDWTHSCIFGDDLIANWSKTTINRYLGSMGEIGFKMNKKKEFRSRRTNLFCGTYLDFKHREVLQFPEYKSILSTKTDTSFDEEHDLFIRIKEVNNLAISKSNDRLAKRIQTLVRILYGPELELVKRHCPLYVPELYGGFGLLPWGKNQSELTVHMKLIFNSSPYKDRIQISKGITSCWQKAIQDTELREIEYLTADFLEGYSSPSRKIVYLQKPNPETSQKIQEITEHLRSTEQYWVHEGRSKLNYTKQTVWDCIKRINLKLRSILSEYEETIEGQPIMYNIKDIRQMNVNILRNRCRGFSKTPELPMYLNSAVTLIVNELLNLDAITVIETLKLLKESDKAFVEKLVSVVNQERLLGILNPKQENEVDPPRKEDPITLDENQLILFGQIVSIKA